MFILDELHKFKLDEPSGIVLVRSREEWNNMPSVHKDQIHLLNDEACDILARFQKSSRILEGGSFYGSKDNIPFRKNYFKTIDIHFGGSINGESQLKKWLYQRGIPFRKYVFYSPGPGSCQYVLTTWKMLVKYCWSAFFGSDNLVFDETLNWALYYHHDGNFYFGKDRIFDPEEKYREMAELNELKIKYPFLNWPY